MPELRIRPARSADGPAIAAVHQTAFPTDAEARLVALLIERGKATVSLVAEVEGVVAGHVLFSPACVGSVCRTEPEPPTNVAPAGAVSPRQAEPTGLGLAPLAVQPQFQNQGLGAALVRAGLDECRHLGIPWVVVLGSPAYYGRFGFAPASRWNLTCDYDGGDAFQFLPLTKAAEAIGGGHVSYASEFGEIFSE